MFRKDKHKMFLDFIDQKSIFQIARIFKTSDSSIKRYKADSIEIPNTIIVIIRLTETIEMRDNNIRNLEFELISIKQVIHDYKSSQKALFDV